MNNNYQNKLTCMHNLHNLISWLVKKYHTKHGKAQMLNVYSKAWLYNSFIIVALTQAKDSLTIQDTMYIYWFIYIYFF